MTFSQYSPFYEITNVRFTETDYPQNNSDDVLTLCSTSSSRLTVIYL